MLRRRHRPFRVLSLENRMRTRGAARRSVRAISAIMWNRPRDRGCDVKRFPFLDWMRGLAVVIMIQCHTFNSFTRVDLHDGGPYVLTQFVGGMAAPLFLLMAGMTTAFQMESLERREPKPLRRWLISLKRAAYILAIAFTFRFTNWLFSVPHANLSELTKVDILNCMGVGMAARAALAMFPSNSRTRFAVAAGLLIATAAPLMTNLPWGDSPALVVIRVGICMMIMAGAYLWTEYCAGPGWSWMQAMGKNSLQVYWVHVMIVYGSLVGPIKRTLSIPQGALATVIVTLTMIAMSALWLAWKSRRAARRAAAAV